MKLIYITNTRLPSEKANSYQSMQMCSSFAREFKEVELWTGKAHNTKEMVQIENIFKFYNINNNFSIKKFFQLDLIILRELNEFLWANTRDLIFSLNVSINLIKFRKDTEVVIYTRVWHIVYIVLFLKKIGLVNNHFFYESHKFSKFLLKALSRIDGLVVINKYLYNIYKNHGLSEVYEAHDGVNIDDFSDIEEYKFIPNKKEYKLVYTGSLYPWKGVRTLVESLEFLPEKIKLICIGGNGKYLIDFKKFVKKKSEIDRITIIPHIPKVELITYLEQADVLVLPNSKKDVMSYYTSPIKMFEYMASKRPIVASNLPSITEILSENNSFLFEPDNAKDLAKKIQNIISIDCTKIIKQSYKDVKPYAWEKRAQNIQRFINSIHKKTK
jgi:glycosyltransferase involved in cell wall biosynthesis